MFGIRKSIGLAMTIIALKFLVGSVFFAIESTLLTVLSAVDHTFQYVDQIVTSLPR